MDNVNPLTPQHLDQINAALKQLDIADQQANMAERAGVDVSAQKAQIADYRTKLLRLKQVYFPGQ